MAKYNIVAEDKNIPINKGTGTSSTVVGVSGTFGAATVQFMRSDGSTLVPMLNNTIETEKEYKIQHGTDMNVYVSVTGSDGSTDINLIVSPFRA